MNSKFSNKAKSHKVLTQAYSSWIIFRFLTANYKLKETYKSDRSLLEID